MTAERFEPFFARLVATRAGDWVAPLRRLTTERLHPARHGDLPDWQAALAALPAVEPGAVRLDSPCVSVAPRTTIDPANRQALRVGLDALHPWRKGPFCLHGVTIDAEWRSDWKWARLAEAITPLNGRLVLDVGCGNGYYGYRALGAGAALVLGIDPTLRFVLQFLALNHYLRESRLAVLPAADIDLPASAAAGPFDSVFSMGVLYHRRDAAAHLARLHQALRPGGQLVLETLVLPGGAQVSATLVTGGDGQDCRTVQRRASPDRTPGGWASHVRPRPSVLPTRDASSPGHVLHPPGRYARMRNVHAIAGIDALADWIAAAGFRRIEVVDIARTTTDEQRSTEWMRFESLDRCLDPADPTRTVEGHPAPTRAVLLAERP